MRFEKITLNQIRKHQPCQDGWEKLLKHLGKTKADDKPLSLNTILKSNGLADALWCLRVLPVSLATNQAITSLKVSFVLPVKLLMKDARSIKALEIALSFSKGVATEQELYAAAAAAYTAATDADAADAADVAAYTAYAAAYAADAADGAAYTATAAAYAAFAAAADAALAAYADGADAAYAAAYTAARKIARRVQKNDFQSWVFGNEK